VSSSSPWPGPRRPGSSSPHGRKKRATFDALQLINQHIHSKAIWLPPTPRARVFRVSPCNRLNLGEISMSGCAGAEPGSYPGWGSPLSVRIAGYLSR
jgi:hypothetical protein